MPQHLLPNQLRTLQWPIRKIGQNIWNWDNFGKPERMITPTTAQRAHTDSHLITTDPHKIVKYLPNMLHPANFLFFRKLCNFPDTFSVYCKKVVFPGNTAWALESFYLGISAQRLQPCLSYKGQVTRPLWALNSLGLKVRKKNSLSCWVVVLIKWDICLWIHPNFLLVSFS